MNGTDSTIAKAALSVDRGISFLAWVAAVSSLSAMFVALFLEVVVRYITKSSLGWTTEVPAILFPWLVMGGAVLAAQRGQHIAVTAIIPALSTGLLRILIIVLQLLVIGVFSWLAYMGMDVIHIVATEVYPVTRVSSEWAYWALIAGLGGLVLTAVSNIILVATAQNPLSVRESEVEIEL